MLCYVEGDRRGFEDSCLRDPVVAAKGATVGVMAWADLAESVVPARAAK